MSRLHAVDKRLTVSAPSDVLDPDKAERTKQPPNGREGEHGA